MKKGTDVERENLMDAPVKKESMQAYDEGADIDRTFGSMNLK